MKLETNCKKIKLPHTPQTQRLKQYVPKLPMGFPGGSEVKVSACNVGDPGSIPGSERSPGEGNGNPLQYPCLGKPTDRELDRLQSMSCKDSDITEHVRNLRKLHFPRPPHS